MILWLLVAASLVPLALLFALPSRMQAQTDSLAGEAEVGILRTRTADEAKAVLDSLKAGMDFAVLAKEHSIDASAVNGGDAGKLTSAKLPPPVVAALSGLKPGQYSPVIPVDDGYEVVTIYKVPPSTKDLDARQIYALTAAGTVQQNISISGLDEADAVFKQYPKPAGWNKDLSEPCRIRKESYAAAVARTEQFLASPTAQTVAPLRLQQAHAAMAQLLGYQGEMQKSAEQWKMCLRHCAGQRSGRFALCA